MANPYHDHNSALLAHLRGILLAMGEAEQVSEESHALFLERFDELIMNLQNVPEERHMGQDLICRSSIATRRSPTSSRATCSGSSAATACTSCRTRKSPYSSNSRSAATKPSRTTNRSTGTVKSSY